MLAFGAPADVIDSEHLCTENRVTAFGAPPHRIDLLASISGVSFDDAIANAVWLDIGGEPLPVIGLDALRANKKASKRRKDLDDVKRLASVRVYDTTTPSRRDRRRSV